MRESAADPADALETSAADPADALETSAADPRRRARNVGG
jgi:hypothetical protein